MQKKIKNASYNFIILSITLLFCFTIGELSLRVFYPKYTYAAESSFDSDKSRIWVRIANTHYKRKHPDSGETHLVFHNNLALRQHRNFYKSDIFSAINIGFFGDSFTENLRLPSQYSFTEPLDYILNTRGSNFNVLNFGVDGYGTDQSYLYYIDFEYSINLNYVFYVFCINDLKNIYENNLFTINDSHEVIQTTGQATPLWVKVFSKFHTTYLILDVLYKWKLLNFSITNNQKIEKHYQRTNREKRKQTKRSNNIDEALINGLKTEDLDKSITIFRSLIRLWKQKVEENGGEFYIVLLPRIEEHNVRYLFPEEFTLIDLYNKFEDKYDNYQYKDWRFLLDSHWNEAANKETAIFLYRFIEDKMRYSPLSDAILNKEIYTYYSSFNGWKPIETPDIETIINNNKKQYIKSKYNNIR